MPFQIASVYSLDKIAREVYSGDLAVSSIVRGASDANWMKEWDQFYSKRSGGTPCVDRLRLKSNGKRMGICHLRPISDGSRLSETYISPPEMMSEQNGFYIKCLRSIEKYGERPILCVPFIMPEGTFGMCIHGALWITLEILRDMSAGLIKGMTIPAIQQLATGHPYADRQGLRFVTAARILRMNDCNAFYYNSVQFGEYLGVDDQNLITNTLVNVLYAYIESGLPTIMGVDVGDMRWWQPSAHGYHSIVAIGHTIVDTEVDGFLFHDQSILPYQKLTVDELKAIWHQPPTREGTREIREMVVPVPPWVEVRYEVALWDCLDYLMFFADNSWIDIDLYKEETIRPILTFLQRSGVEDSWFSRVLSMIGRKWSIYPPPMCWMMFFHRNSEDRLASRCIGAFIRDATKETDLRLGYFPSEDKVIVLMKGRFYQYAKTKTGRVKVSRLRPESDQAIGNPSS